ncbi:PIG-L deacetylase family protein [Pelagibacterium halotolerans]|uniref:LmbE family protein n=1 Tax=Pelagibacterium halotolerans (strain DSM 22347 / JCM 15775 / CGMCC 1.7692 / B2) TaxID=1082931 RepID=G4RBM9_PELHB|nr:PIG-L deacetylase family protein [Pelagibacterium halotolerans]AEQ53670.1 LmbE family protein [Pelagibacterium halotolerans B2]QJR20161.1 PIG-L family deacetylase [Pelagibacterium halotolerans]SEA90631.1 N-acetylglucosaminyl deacetylase, LmbE family [Pelagibacterium halotolerans]
MTILALGAHPDDIEIFMFGTLAAFKAMGQKLVFGIATDGARGGTADGLAQTRAREAQAAAGLLGADLRFLGFADGALMPDAALVESLRGLIEQTRPDLILTHAPNDYHGDHRALSQAASLASSFKVPLAFVDTLYGTGFTPTHYVEITGHMALKEQAILCHESQDPGRFIEMARLQNRSRSAQCYRPDGYAEALRFEPRAPFADIRGLLPPAPSVNAVWDRSRGKKA